MDIAALAGVAVVAIVALRVVDAGAPGRRVIYTGLMVSVLPLVPVSLAYGAGAWVARWASGGPPR